MGLIRVSACWGRGHERRAQMGQEWEGDFQGIMLCDYLLMCTWGSIQMNELINLLEKEIAKDGLKSKDGKGEVEDTSNKILQSYNNYKFKHK